MTEPAAVPLLFLDIDGTVRRGKNELGRFVNGPDDVVVFPEAVEMMRRWKTGGGRIVGVSNQGGIALGHQTQYDCEQAMIRTHQLTDGLFDRIAWCGHHPSAESAEAARCWCRKPAPGLLIVASITLAKEHNERYPLYMALMVGDRHEDQECARIANVDFTWANEWRSHAATDPESAR